MRWRNTGSLTIALILLMFLLAHTKTTPVVAYAEPQSADSHVIPTVLFCDLVRNPNLYNNKIVRLRAMYQTTVETDVLFHPDCSERENLMKPQLECDKEKSCDQMRETISNNLVGGLSNMQAELLMIGKFKGPAEAGKCFGSPIVKGCLRFEFSITQIEEAKPTQSKAFPPCDNP